MLLKVLVNISEVDKEIVSDKIAKTLQDEFDFSYQSIVGGEPSFGGFTISEETIG